MLDKLINLVRDNAGDGIINNNKIPNEKNEQAVSAAGSSIFESLQRSLEGGKVADVLSYFKNGGKSEDNKIVKDATHNYASQLQQQVGIGEAEAHEAAQQVVPKTMNQLASQTADPSNNNFNIQDIFNKLSGGKTGGMNIQSILNKFGGGKLDKDGDGDVDLQDLKSIFSGGGLMDSVKGMFK